MKEVKAAPQMIPSLEDHPLNNAEANKKQYRAFKKVVATKSLPVLDIPYPSAELYNLRNMYFVLDHERERVAYLMKYEVRTIRGKKAAYQVMVWSNPDISSMRKYASTVFFEQLFEKTDLVTTDRQQTPAGQRFWRNAVDIALMSHYRVYFLNMKSKKSIPIKSTKDIAKLEDSIWTDVEKGTGNLLIISKSL